VMWWTRERGEKARIFRKERWCGATRVFVLHGSVEEIQPLISFCASSAEAVQKRGYVLIIAKSKTYHL